MGLFDNILNKIAPPEDDNYGEPAYTPEQTPYYPRDPREPRPQENNAGGTAPAISAPVRQNTGIGTNVMGSAIEMKVVKPDKYEMVADIADLLLAGNTVLLNLEDTNKETTRRLIDFMTGVAYAIKGDLRRIANNTYVVTPVNVKVSDSEGGENAASVGTDTAEIF